MANNYVYFIRGEDGLIKIGQSQSPTGRAKELDGYILATIPASLLERKLHHRFRHLREHGEWFRADPELMAFIAKQGRPDLARYALWQKLPFIFGVCVLTASAMSLIWIMWRGIDSSPYLWFVISWFVADLWGIACLAWLYNDTEKV